MRKEIQKECDHLKEWGMIFKQALADSCDGNAEAYYQTCVDAYEALQGRTLRFHTEISLHQGLKNIIKIIDALSYNGHFKSYDKYISTKKMFLGICEMLEPKADLSSVQTALF